MNVIIGLMIMTAATVRAVIMAHAKATVKAVNPVRFIRLMKTVSMTIVNVAKTNVKSVMEGAVRVIAAVVKSVMVAVFVMRTVLIVETVLAVFASGSVLATRSAGGALVLRQPQYLILIVTLTEAVEDCA
jgi:hypothetical protein